MKKLLIILKQMYTPMGVLYIGVLGVILSWIPTGITFWLGWSILIGIVGFIVIKLCIFGWIINPIRSLIKRYRMRNRKPF